MTALLIETLPQLFALNLSPLLLAVNPVPLVIVEFVKFGSLKLDVALTSFPVNPLKSNVNIWLLPIDIKLITRINNNLNFIVFKKNKPTNI